MPLNVVEQGRHRRQDSGSADQDGTKPQDEGKQEPGCKTRLSYIGERTTMKPEEMTANEFLTKYFGKMPMYEPLGNAHRAGDSGRVD